MIAIRTAALAAGLLHASAALAQLDGQVPPSQRAASIPAIDAGSERIAVVQADDLAGRALVTQGGAAAGHLVHVLVDPASGGVRAALVDDVPGLALNGQSLVVSWPKLASGTAGHTMSLALASADLATLPRIRNLSVAAGERPEVTAQIIDFVNGADGSDTPVDIANPPPPSGPRTTVTAGPPILVSAHELRGVAVTDQNGGAVGQIGPVMIDLEHSHVAYLLIAEGGLDAATDWLPVPIEMLVPSGNGYALAVEDFWLRQVPPLHSAVSPGSVGSAWLAAIYVNYGIAPYWRSKSP